jgi:hypothetical protein
MSLALHPRLKKAIALKEAPRIAARKRAEEEKKAKKAADRAARKAEKAKTAEERSREVERLLEMTRNTIKDTRDLPECGYYCKNPEPWKETFCSNKVWAPHSTFRCYDHAWNDPAVRWPKCSRGKNAVSHKRGIHPGVCPKEPASGLCYFCIKADELEYTRSVLAGETPAVEPTAGGSPLPSATLIPEYPLMMPGSPMSPYFPASDLESDLETPSGGKTVDLTETPVFDWDVLPIPDELSRMSTDHVLIQSVPQSPVPPSLRQDVIIVQQQTPAIAGEYLAMVHAAATDLGLSLNSLNKDALDRAYICIRKDEEADGKSRERLIAACDFLYNFIMTCC